MPGLTLTFSFDELVSLHATASAKGMSVGQAAAGLVRAALTAQLAPIPGKSIGRPRKEIPEALAKQFRRLTRPSQARASQRVRIIIENLETGPKTTQDLAEASGETPNGIEVILRNWVKKGEASKV